MGDCTIGTIQLQDSVKLVFSVSEWHGQPFASMRKFVATQKYEGPTKSGIALSHKMLRELTLALPELEFYLGLLARECDVFEYLLTGADLQ